MKWFLVTEKLPEDYNEIIFELHQGGYFAGFFRKDKFYVNLCELSFPLCYVQRWFCLPESKVK